MADDATVVNRNEFKKKLTSKNVPKIYKKRKFPSLKERKERKLALKRASVAASDDADFFRDSDVPLPHKVYCTVKIKTFSHVQLFESLLYA